MGTCPGGTALVEARDWIDPERVEVDVKGQRKRQ